LLYRPEEWVQLVAAIRAKYGNRPRFMETLDRVKPVPIVSKRSDLPARRDRG
jgi:hypothetical protein